MMKGRKRQKNNSRAAQRRLDHLRSAAFLGPSFGGLLLFYILPFFVVIFYAVVDNPISHNFVGLNNFIQVLRNNAFQKAAKNMAIFSGISVPLAVVLSLLLACMLEAKIPLRSQFRTFFLSPLMVPVASIVLIWQVVFHYNGVLNEFLAVFGVEKIDWLKSEYNRYVVVLLFLWKNLGYNMILFIAALGNVPKDVLEMASLEGAGAVRTFFSIKLPYLTPSLLFVTILSLINSFKIFREVYLLTGSYPYDGLYLMQHFMNNMFESMDYQKLCAAALLLAGVMTIIIGILFLVEYKAGKDVET
jgi:multiple sugar transport system permease protein